MTTTKKLIKAQRHIIDAINSDIDERGPAVNLIAALDIISTLVAKNDPHVTSRGFLCRPSQAIKCSIDSIDSAVTGLSHGFARLAGLSHGKTSEARLLLAAHQAASRHIGIEYEKDWQLQDSLLTITLHFDESC